jgi:hypothetical protein
MESAYSACLRENLSYIADEYPDFLDQDGIKSLQIWKEGSDHLTLPTDSKRLHSVKAVDKNDLSAVVTAVQNGNDSKVNYAPLAFELVSRIILRQHEWLKYDSMYNYLPLLVNSNHDHSTLLRNTLDYMEKHDIIDVISDSSSSQLLFEELWSATTVCFNKQELLKLSNFLNIKINSSDQRYVFMKDYFLLLRLALACYRVHFAQW